MTATLQAAHAVAAHGWPVIPVAVVIDGRCMCGWPADRCTSPGKHPLNPGGCRNASVDPDTITGWWRRWPHANVGIATGRGSGIAVLDIDGNPGRDALARLEAAHGPLPGTVTATTGRGCHLYYKWPAGLGIGSGQYGRGLDHRGEGGYVLAPPSSHPSGHMYQWLAADDNDPTPWAHELTDWPVQALPVERPRAERPVVVPLHRDPVEPAGILAGLVRTVLEAPVGQRNHTLNWAAYRAGEHIRAGRLNQVHAVTVLQLAGERAGLTVTESRATIASGLRAGAA